MKRYFLIISAMLFLLSSCQDLQRTKRPDDLIPEEKMVDIITEVSLLQGARSYHKEILEQNGLNPREYIWRRFDVDSSQFARSSNFYAENYEQYQRIYDSVKSRLEEMKDVYDSLRQEEERVKDSISAEVRSRDSLRIRNDSLILIDSIVPIDSIVDSPKRFPEPITRKDTIL